MLKTPKNYQYAPITDTTFTDYIIAPGDKFELLIFSNKGYKLVDPQIMSDNISMTQTSTASLTYDVSATCDVSVPMVGAINLCGMTETQAQDTLSVLYKQFYIEPYVQLRVVNRHVTVFRGNSPAFVVSLPDYKMTIMEAIGAAGGIPPDAKSSKIKLIRNENGEPKISSIDLSTIAGLDESNLPVKANDIIYIEPTINSQFFKEIAPIIGAVSSVVIIYFYIANFK